MPKEDVVTTVSENITCYYLVATLLTGNRLWELVGRGMIRSSSSSTPGSITLACDHGCTGPVQQKQTAAVPLELQEAKPTRVHAQRAQTVLSGDGAPALQEVQTPAFRLEEPKLSPPETAPLALQPQGGRGAPALHGVLIFHHRVFSAPKYMTASFPAPNLVTLTMKVPSALMDAHPNVDHPFYFNLHLEALQQDESVVLWDTPVVTPKVVAPVVSVVAPVGTPVVAPVGTPVGAPVGTPVGAPVVAVPVRAPVVPPVMAAPVTKKKRISVQGRFGNDHNYSHEVAMAMEANRQRQRV